MNSPDASPDDLRDTPAYRRMVRVLEAWRGVMFNTHQELQLHQVLAAAQRGKPRHRELKQAINAAIGTEGDQLKKFGRWIQRWQRRGGLRSDDWELVERKPGTGSLRYYRVVRPGEVDRFGHPTRLLIAPALPPPDPVALQSECVPAVAIVDQPTVAVIDPPLLVYPDGRVRGARHRATLAKAAADIQTGGPMRSVAQPLRASVQMQPARSVFADAGPAPFDDGPTLPQMRWKPSNA